MVRHPQSPQGFSIGGKKMSMNHHPAANSFPMMDEKRYRELVEDMRKHGQLEPITVCEEMILDGRNRHNACLELNIIPKTRHYDGDPWAYVWSLNGERRDLVAEQRYLIWKLCHEHSNTFQAEKHHIQEEANRKRSEAATARERTQAGTFEPVVEQSVQPVVKEPKERKAKVSASKTNPGAVARGDKLAKERPDLAEKVRLGELKPAEAHRQMKKGEVSEKVGCLPEGKYRVLYADPPWQYNDTQAVKGDYGTGTGAAEGHFPIMSLTDLKAMDVCSISAEDSVLFLWVTSPLIENGLELCRAWSFTYKAMFIWDKVKHNMGHYNSVRHELLLICTKGSCLPENNKLFDSVQVIERTSEHSRKPKEFRVIIDTLYPSGPRIELFRRGDRPDGWHIWGNEAEPTR